MDLQLCGVGQMVKDQLYSENKKKLLPLPSDWCVCVCVRTINMPISTEGSGMPTTRPNSGSPV